MMLTINLSNKFVMLIWLPWIKNLLTLNKRTQNYKLFLMTLTQLKTKRLDKRKQRKHKRLNSKKSSMRLNKREMNKLVILKLKEKNTHSFHKYWLKQEDSSQTTSKPHPSYKREKKESTSPHKSWLKLLVTWVKVHTKPAQWNTSEHMERLSNC